jgi:hypothetical protein
MNLFSLIPGNFFSLLASGNREIYFDALMLLNDYLKNDLNIKVDDYIASLIALLEDKNFIPEEEDVSPLNPEVTAGDGRLPANIKAHLILKRLIDTGWVDREYMDGSFTDILTPRDYAIRVMQLLDELRDEKIHEYNSLVFSTYSALKQAQKEEPREMFEAILAAKRNTEQLNYELTSLYHNIRTYIRRIQEQSNINELLENHFEKFKPMADRIYHPIKTMDSIHRYMTPIKDILIAIREDDDLMAGMRKRAMMVRKYEYDDEAGTEILSALNFVLDTYGRLGNTTGEIDKKYHAYIKNSTEKMTYMMTADQSIKGKLLEIFKVYAASAKKDRDTIGGMLEENVRIFRQHFLDGASLFHRNILSRRLNGEPLEINTDTAFADSAMEGLVSQMKNVYSLERIRLFMADLFAKAGLSVLESAQLPIEEDADFVLLILAVIRAHERGMEYTVELEDGTVEHNGYRIPNMKIRKKEGKINV